MNRIDLVIFLIILLFAISGFFRGIIKELISLIGIAGGFFFAVWKTEGFIKPLADILPWSEHLVFISIFGLVFIISSALIGIGLSFLYFPMKSGSRGFIQRAAGGFFGLFKGIMFISILTLLLPLFPLDPVMIQEKNNAILFKPFRAVAPAILEWTAGIFPQTESSYHHVKEQFGRIDSKRPAYVEPQEQPQKHDRDENK